MEKHEFNIFPDMSAEEFQRLKADIQKNGFDQNYPIMLYDNQIKSNDAILNPTCTPEGYLKKT